MSILARTFRQMSLYTFFSIITLFVSFISFPITTRIFSVEQYGDFAIVNATILILLVVAKSGITSSFIRNYPEFAEEKKKYLYSSSIAGSFTFALAVFLFYSVTMLLLKRRIGTQLTEVFLMAGLTILSGSLDNLYSGYLRAEEKVLTLNVIGFVSKFGTVLSGLAICMLLIKNLSGYFLGVVIFDFAMAAGMSVYFYKRGLFKMDAVSFAVFKKLYAYGLPLVFYEISTLINDYSDRFLIKFYLGARQVGIYSAAYNMSLYTQGIINNPLWMTVFPIYTKLWSEKGPEETKRFLSLLLKYYICIGIIMVLSMSLLSKDLITILATKKYAPAAPIVPIIISSVMIYGTFHITGAGFYLMNQTRKIGIYMFVSALINIAVNLFMIPKYGIIGAAYSTFISYGLLTILINYKAGKLIKVKWPVRDIAFFISLAVIIELFLSRINFTSALADLILKSAALFPVYGLFLIFYFKKINKLKFSNMNID